MNVSELHFYEDHRNGDKKWFTYFSGFRITVVDRMTGFGDGIRDIETGLKDYSIKSDDDFWLASGNFDIRSFGDLDIYDAIEKIKENANTVIPNRKELKWMKER